MNFDQSNYLAKIQFAREETALPPSAIGIKHIKRLVGKLLYYSHDIASSKRKGTQTAWKALKDLLNYKASNPDTENIFLVSKMLYKIDSDAVYLVCPEAQS